MLLSAAPGVFAAKCLFETSNVLLKQWNTTSRTCAPAFWHVQLMSRNTQSRVKSVLIRLCSSLQLIPRFPSELQEW